MSLPLRFLTILLDRVSSQYSLPGGSRRQKSCWLGRNIVRFLKSEEFIFSFLINLEIGWFWEFSVGSVWILQGNANICYGHCSLVYYVKMNESIIPSLHVRDLFSSICVLPSDRVHSPCCPVHCSAWSARLSSACNGGVLVHTAQPTFWEK